MKVYDCFMFFDELDLLEIRLNELDSVVDQFVLCEATRTCRLHPKVLHYERNKERFEKFHHKITHLIVDDSYDPWPGHKQFAYERMQREYLERGLRKCEPDDLIVISDVDELYRPECVALAKERVAAEPNRSVPVRLRNCMYYINTAWAERMPGPVFMTQQYFASTFGRSMKLARESRRHGKPIFQGGWHMSCFGGVEAVRRKLLAFSHWEYAKPKILNKLEENMQNLVEYSKGHKLYLADENDLPEYVKNNMERFGKYVYRHHDDGDTAPGDHRANDPVVQGELALEC